MLAPPESCCSCCSYDAAGNPTVVGLPTAEIEPSGRLAFLATPFGNGWYTYDAAGRRVVKRTRTYGASGGAGGGATVLYVYDLQDRLLGEYAAGGGTPLREYVWLGDIPVAMLETDPANPAGAPRGRTLLQTHACMNPFGPSLPMNPPPEPCSRGCITGFAPDIARLNGRLDAEPGSLICVVD